MGPASCSASRRSSRAERAGLDGSRVMRRLLLWAARNRWLRDHLSRMRFVRRAVRRFMPGEELTDALDAAEAYRRDGIGSVLTLLGENLTVIGDADGDAA